MKVTRKEFLVRSAALVAPGLAMPGMSQVAGRAPGPLTHGTLGVFNVVDYGAKGDGRVKDTSAIQAAIDGAGDRGGVVYLPPGNYLSGTVRLKNFVTLYLAPGATLLASPEQGDFDPYEKLDYDTFTDEESTYYHNALIRAEDVHNIAVLGEGVVDGNRPKRGGPKPIAFKRCQHISIRGITLKNAPNYNISLLGCDYVDIDGITILNGFADGIDPECCQYVRIANCFIESWDDAIVPKTTFGLGYVRPTENLTVTNCVLATACNALKLGTDSCGDFKNIAFNNCAVLSRREKWGRGPIAGLALEAVDGGNIDRVVVSNIAMDDVKAAFFIRLGDRGRSQKVPAPGVLQNVSLSNITATRTTLASSITGIPAHHVKGVTLSDIRISAMGGGAAEDADREVPEVTAQYPEADMFGELPAYGLYCRHVKGVVFSNIQFELGNPDQRPALVADDASGIDLLSFRAAPPSGDRPVVLLRDVREALVQGSRALAGTRTYLTLNGQKAQKVHVIASDLSEATRPFNTGDEVQKGALVERGNFLASVRSR